MSTTRPKRGMLSVANEHNDDARPAATLACLRRERRPRFVTFVAVTVFMIINPSLCDSAARNSDGSSRAVWAKRRPRGRPPPALQRPRSWLTRGGGGGGVAPPPPVGTPVGGVATTPSTAELAAFTMPLLLIWLANPIMSLLDTAVVGARSSVELAALGPATAICDRIAYIITFLASSTTSLAAAALADGDNRGAAAAVTTGLAAAGLTGVAVTTALCRYGRVLLEWFLGGKGGDHAAVAAVLEPALGYVQLRALGYVAVTVSMVLQASCLASKDLRTPLAVVAIQSLANLFGDLFLVFGLGWGIKGAAAATAAAQWAGAIAMAVAVLPKLQKQTSLQKGKGVKSGLRLPSAAALGEFARLGLPTMLALALQTATCGMLAFAAAACSTAALAAHQVMYAVFNLFCVIGEALSQTVQAYLPALLKRPRANTTSLSSALSSTNATSSSSGVLRLGPEAWRLMRSLFAVAAGLGLADAAAAAALAVGAPFVFTPDREVWAWMRRGAPLLAACLVVHALTFAMQGALLATRDVTALAVVYAVSSAVFGASFVRARGRPSTTVPGLWLSFALFHVWRAGLFAAVLLARHGFSSGGGSSSSSGGGSSSSCSSSNNRSGTGRAS